MRTSSRLMLHLLLLLLAIVFLAGCLPRGAVPLKSLATGSHALSFEPSASVQMVDDGEAFAALWAVLRPHAERPVVDFEQDRVLVAFMGQRPTGGYAVRFTESVVDTQDPATRIVELEWIEPPAGALLTQAVTAPYAMATIPRGTYRHIEVRRSGQVMVRIGCYSGANLTVPVFDTLGRPQEHSRGPREGIDHHSKGDAHAGSYPPSRRNHRHRLRDHRHHPRRQWLAGSPGH